MKISLRMLIIIVYVYVSFQILVCYQSVGFSHEYVFYLILYSDLW